MLRHHGVHRGQIGRVGELSLQHWPSQLVMAQPVEDAEHMIGRLVEELSDSSVSWSIGPLVHRAVLPKGPRGSHCHPRGVRAVTKLPAVRMSRCRLFWVWANSAPG